ncbi:MAG TPA: DUF1499 domain-containing protein [Stellaceae bacterium]|nr:DUF1499 domain-containing protein [Stellaceae bacterium]
MTQTSHFGRRRPSWIPAIAVLGAVVALAAAVILIVAPLGYRVGIWSLRTALLDLPRTWVFYTGIAGAVISLLALGVTVAGKRRGWAALAILGIVVGASAVYVPWKFAQMGRAVPPVNDITTDTANPPDFEAVMPLRAAANAEPVTYGPDFPALQQKAFPDIVPAHLDKPVDQAFALALDAVRKMGWTVVAADGERGRIEATDRTLWYGFTDDIVVRVSADGTGARIDVRSKSRIGRGDFGTNARRVRAYLAAIKSAGGAS